MPIRSTQPHAVSYSDIQPPGVSPTTSFTVGSQSSVGSGQAELPPGIDNREHVVNAETKDEARSKEQLDAWTAHRSETGILYYYNALTTQSTYEKPTGFKGQSDRAIVQPTPISWWPQCHICQIFRCLCLIICTGSHKKQATRFWNL